MITALLLCVNVGSSSMRIAAYEQEERALKPVFPRTTVDAAAWRDALPPDFSPGAVVHRIVRGAKTDVAAELFTDLVGEEIRSMREFAPAHDTKALEVLAAAARLFPDARQYVAYDTAFHATLPLARRLYAVPAEWSANGIRRVGYHGLSCAFAADWLRDRAGAPERAVHAHLGSGCSVTGLLNGRSAATSMGLTPLEGLVMATRSGSIDPGALLFLARRGMSAEEMQQALYHQSGLLALCGTADMREIEIRRAQGDAAAALAFDVFVDAAAGAIAHTAALLDGVNAISFAGGIGCNSAAIRESICAKLRWFGAGASVPVYAFDAEEERIMARAACSS